MALDEQGYDPDESVEDYVARRNKIPNLLEDHAAWLKWYLAETEDQDEERSKWWVGRVQDFRGKDLEWDKTYAELKLTVWSQRLSELKKTVRRKNLDSKTLDLIMTKEYRDTLAIFEDQTAALQEWHDKLVSRLSSIPEGPRAESAPPAEVIIYSKKGYSQAQIGKWLSPIESSDEKVYRVKFKEIQERYPSIVNQIGPQRFQVSWKILRLVWQQEKIRPIEQPGFEGE